MTEQEFKDIYEKLKNNSIGEEKKSSNKRIKVQATLKKGIAAFLSVFAISSMVGCGMHVKSNDEKDNNSVVSLWDINGTWNGYSYDQIVDFEENRVKEVLEINHMEDYTKEGHRRNYKYTADDYKKVIEFDESYIGGFYHLTDTYSLDQFCASRGYENFHDYLEKNGYTTEDGKDNLEKWQADNLEKISQKMKTREAVRTK